MVLSLGRGNEIGEMVSGVARTHVFFSWVHRLVWVEFVAPQNNYNGDI